MFHKRYAYNFQNLVKDWGSHILKFKIEVCSDTYRIAALDSDLTPRWPQTSTSMNNDRKCKKGELHHKVLYLNYNSQNIKFSKGYSCKTTC